MQGFRLEDCAAFHHFAQSIEAIIALQERQTPAGKHLQSCNEKPQDRQACSRRWLRTAVGTYQPVFSQQVP